MHPSASKTRSRSCDLNTWETPGLLLSPADVARHLALDRPTAAVLRALEHSHFLRRTPDGRFALARHLDGDIES